MAYKSERRKNMKIQIRAAHQKGTSAIKSQIC